MHKKIKKVLTKILSNSLILAMLGTTYIPLLSFVNESTNLVYATEVCAEGEHEYALDEDLLDLLSETNMPYASCSSNILKDYYSSLPLTLCCDNSSTISAEFSTQIRFNSFTILKCNDASNQNRFSQSKITYKNGDYKGVMYSKYYIEGEISDVNNGNETSPYEIVVIFFEDGTILYNFIKIPTFYTANYSKNLNNSNDACIINNISNGSIIATYQNNGKTEELLLTKTNNIFLKHENEVASSCSEEGSYDLVCTICSDVKTINVPTTPHEFEQESGLVESLENLKDIPDSQMMKLTTTPTNISTSILWGSSKLSTYEGILLDEKENNLIINLRNTNDSIININYYLYETTLDNGDKCLICRSRNMVTGIIPFDYDIYFLENNKIYFRIIRNIGTYDYKLNYFDFDVNNQEKIYTDELFCIEKKEDKSIDFNALLSPYVVYAGNNQEELYYCTVCENYYVDGVTLYNGSTYSHNYELVETTVTCTEDGVSKYICHHCDEEGTIVHEEALGHDYEKEIKKNATCEEEGEIEYTCSRCGDTYTEAIAKVDHQYTEEITTAATCTNDGLKTFNCDNCSNSYTETIPKIGHHYVVTHVKEPNLTEDGLYHYVCENCGDNFDKVIKKLSPFSIYAGKNGIGIYDGTNKLAYVTGTYALQNSVSIIEENNDAYGNREIKLLTSDKNKIKMQDKNFWYGNPMSLDSFYLNDSGIQLEADGYYSEFETRFQPSRNTFFRPSSDFETATSGLKDRTIKVHLDADKVIHSKWLFTNQNNDCGYVLYLKDGNLYSASGYIPEYDYDENSQVYLTRYPKLFSTDDIIKDVSAYHNNIMALTEDGDVVLLNAEYCNYYHMYEISSLNSNLFEITRTQNIKFDKISSGLKMYGIDEDGYIREIFEDGTYSEKLNDIKYDSISSGNGHVLAIDENGNIWAFGKNTYGQVGNNTKGIDVDTPVQITENIYFTQVAAGEDISVALDTNYNVYTWGLNDKQQLGLLKDSLNSVVSPTILYNVEHVHIYNRESYELTKKSKCTDNGLIKRTCILCPNIETIICEPQPHDYIKIVNHFNYFCNHTKDVEDSYVTLDSEKVSFTQGDAYLVAVKDSVNNKTYVYALTAKYFPSLSTIFKKGESSVAGTSDSVVYPNEDKVDKQSFFYNIYFYYMNTNSLATNIDNADLVLNYTSTEAAQYTNISTFIVDSIYSSVKNDFNTDGSCNENHTDKYICKTCYDIKEEVTPREHNVSMIGDRTSEEGYIVWKCSLCGEEIKREPITYNINFTKGSSTQHYAFEMNNVALKYDEPYILPDVGSNSGTVYYNLGPFRTESGKHIIEVQQEVDKYVISGIDYYPGDEIKNLTNVENQSIPVKVYYKATYPEDDLKYLYYKDSKYEVANLANSVVLLNGWQGLIFRYDGNTYSSFKAVPYKPNEIYDVKFNLTCVSDTNEYLDDTNEILTAFTSNGLKETATTGYLFNSILEFKEAMPEYAGMTFTSRSRTIEDKESPVSFNNYNATVQVSNDKINGHTVYIINNCYSVINENELWCVYSYSNSYVTLVKNDPFDLYTKYILHDSINNTTTVVTDINDIYENTLSPDKSKILKKWTTDVEGKNNFFSQSNLKGEINLYAQYEDISFLNKNYGIPQFKQVSELKKGMTFTPNEIFLLGEVDLNNFQSLFTSNSITNTSVSIKTDDKNVKDSFNRHINHSNHINALSPLSDKFIYYSDANGNNYINFTPLTSNIENIENKEIIKTGENVLFTLGREAANGELIYNATNEKINVLYNNKIYTPKYIYLDYTTLQDVITNETSKEDLVYITSSGLEPITYDGTSNTFENDNHETLANSTRVYYKNNVFELNNVNTYSLELHGKNWSKYDIDLLMRDIDDSYHYYEKKNDGIYYELNIQSDEFEELYKEYIYLYLNGYLSINTYLEAYILYALNNDINIDNLLSTESFYILTFPFEEELKQYSKYVEKYTISDVDKDLDGKVKIEFTPTIINLETNVPKSYEFLKTNIQAEALKAPENSEWFIKYDSNHTNPTVFGNFRQLEKNNQIYDLIPIVVDNALNETLKVDIQTFSMFDKAKKEDIKVSLYHNGKIIDLSNSLSTVISENDNVFNPLDGEHIDKIYRNANSYYKDGYVILTKEGHIWVNGQHTHYNGIHAITNYNDATINRNYNSDNDYYRFIRIGGINTKYIDVKVEYEDVIALDENGDVWTTTSTTGNMSGNSNFVKETNGMNFVKIADYAGTNATIGAFLDKDGNIWYRMVGGDMTSFESTMFKSPNNFNGKDYRVNSSTASYIQLTKDIKFTDLACTKYSGLFMCAIDENHDLYLFGNVSNQIGAIQNGVNVISNSDYLNTQRNVNVSSFVKLNDLYPNVYDNVKWKKICPYDNASEKMDYIDMDDNLWSNTNGYEIVDNNILDANKEYLIDTNGKLHTRISKGDGSLDSTIICGDYTFKEMGDLYAFYILTDNDEYILNSYVNDDPIYMQEFYNEISFYHYNSGNNKTNIFALNSLTTGENNVFPEFKELTITSPNNSLVSNLNLNGESILKSGSHLGYNNGFTVDIDYNYLRNIDKIDIQTGDYILINSIDNKTNSLIQIDDSNKVLYGTISTFLTDKNEKESQIKSETPITLNTLKIDRVTSDMNGAVLYLKSKYSNDSANYYSNKMTLDVVPLKALKATYTGNAVKIGQEANPDDITLTLEYDDGTEFTINYEDLTSKPTSLLITNDGDNTFNLGFETKNTNVVIPGEFGISSVTASYSESVWKGEDFDPTKVSVTVTYSDNTTDNPTLDSSYFTSLKVNSVGNNSFSFDYTDTSGYSYNNISFNVEGYYYDSITATYKGNNVKVNTSYNKSDVEAKVKYTHNSFNLKEKTLTNNEWISSIVSNNNIETQSFFVKSWNFVSSFFKNLFKPKSITESLLINNIGDNEFVVTLKDDESIDTTVTITGYDWVTHISATYKGDDIYKGQSYDKDNVEVIAYYSSAGAQTLLSSDWTESGLQVSSIGDNTFTATYNGLTDNYVVKGYEEDHIEATYKGTDIVIDNNYDKDDVEIKVVYTNSTSKILDSSSLWTESGLLVSSLGDNTYTARYKTFTDDYIVKGIDDVDHLTAVYQGNDIYVGQSYDKDDVLVKMVYKSGTESVISSSNWTANSSEVQNVGDNTFIATYNGLTSNYVVKGYEEDHIEATYKGTDIVIGNNYNKDDVEIKVVYTNSTSKILDSSSLWTESGLLVSSLGDNTYTATYKTLTDNYIVKGIDYVTSIVAIYNGPDILVGNQYDKSDVIVTITYASGNSILLSNDDWTEDSLIVSNMGNNDFVANYQGIETSYSINGIDTIDNVAAIYNGPDIYIGNQYDKSNVIVTVYYTSGNSKTLTNDEWIEESLVVSNIDENTYSSSYNTIDFTYTINGYKEQKIEATYKGENKKVGSEYDKNDVKVRVIYTNNSEDILNAIDWTESSLKVENEGQNSYIATYKGLTDEYEVLGYKQNDVSIPSIYHVTKIVGTYPENVLVGNEYIEAKTNILVTYEDENGKTYEESLDYKYLDTKPTTKIVSKVGDNEYAIGYQGVLGTLIVPGYKIDHIIAEYKGKDIEVGKTYDKDDVEVTIYYTNKTSEKTKDWTPNSLDVSKEGENEYIATYKEYTAPYKVKGFKQEQPTTPTTITTTTTTIPQNTTTTPNVVNTIKETVTSYVPTGDTSNIIILSGIVIIGLFILFKKRNKK